jgi:hypothetical protein
MYYRWARVGINGKLIALHSSTSVVSGERATCIPNLIHGTVPGRHTAPSPWCACGWYATQDVRVLASYWCSRDWVLLGIEPYGRCLEDRYRTVRSEYQHIYWAAVPDRVYVEGNTIDGIPIVDRDPASILTDMLPPRLIEWIGRPLSAGDYVWLSRWGTYTRAIATLPPTTTTSRRRATPTPHDATLRYTPHHTYCGGRASR